MDVAGVGATDKTRPEPIVSLNGVHRRSPTTDVRAPSIVNQPYNTRLTEQGLLGLKSFWSELAPLH